MQTKCYSRGNINAPIMIVAQAPGKNELNHSVIDKDKNEAIPMPIPLCGPAGMLGQRMLIWADIMEGDYIMTNIVKKGTFKEGGKYVRPPTEEEILEYREDTIREIAKINPKLIITFGKEALWCLCYHDKISLDEMTIGKHHGVDHKITIDIGESLGFEPANAPMIFSYDILPLYHPAALLRDENGERGFKEAVTNAMQANKERISNLLGRILL